MKKSRQRRSNWDLAIGVLGLVGNAIVLTAVTVRPEHTLGSATLWVLWPFWSICLIATTWLIARPRP
ncbi:hypothetical protein [Streptomyces sp. NBC_00690]|uniref:hypothetical protein n=1 Tax=Streptomyces sp. NBC_00690 TaxID=2975808 RepID=UPI002E292074|nr:hypothetical protein [Streptomyces sp. NBC_00690]